MGPGCPIIARMHTTDIEARDAPGRSRAPSETGSPRPFPRGRPPRRGWPGRRSRRASTCSWSRRRGRARPSPGSWRSSTGSSGPTPRGRSSRACGASISRRCGAWATTSSGTWRSRWRAIRRLLGLDGEPGSRRRPDGRHLGLRPPQAPRPAAAPPDHDPESLSLLLSQAGWAEHWQGVEHMIVDEVHALVPTKRGADLAVSLERLVGPGEPRSLPRRAVGDLPSRRARGAVPGRADADLPGGRGPPARAARRRWRSRSSR